MSPSSISMAEATSSASLLTSCGPAALPPARRPRRRVSGPPRREPPVVGPLFPAAASVRAVLATASCAARTWLGSGLGLGLGLGLGIGLGLG